MSSMHSQSFFKTQVSHSETWTEMDNPEGRVAVLTERYGETAQKRFIISGYNSVMDMDLGKSPVDIVTRRLYNQAEAAVNHWLKTGEMPESNGRR